MGTYPLYEVALSPEKNDFPCSRKIVSAKLTEIDSAWTSRSVPISHIVSRRQDVRYQRLDILSKSIEDLNCNVPGMTHRELNRRDWIEGVRVVLFEGI